MAKRSGSGEGGAVDTKAGKGVVGRYFIRYHFSRWLALPAKEGAPRRLQS
ncbi:MAG: hypothetical protein F7C81_00175 [Desulfurococcales archaeon]|nr:hypothetical protein [Desulfurococcales archaeon]